MRFPNIPIKQEVKDEVDEKYIPDAPEYSLSTSTDLNKHEETHDSIKSEVSDYFDPSENEDDSEEQNDDDSDESEGETDGNSRSSLIRRLCSLIADDEEDELLLILLILAIQQNKLRLEIEERHILTTRRAKYSCNVCGRKFTSFPDLSKHRDTHGNVDSEKSDDDEDPYADDDEGSWHDDEDVDKSDQTEDEEVPLNEVVLLSSKGKISNEVFMGSEKGNDVILDGVSTNDLTCNWCFDAFDNDEDLKAHVKLHSTLSITKTEPIEEKSDSSYNESSMRKRNRNKATLCNYCSASTQSFDHLKTHFDVMQGEGYVCHFCAYETQKTTALSTHIKFAHAKECYVCNEKFPSRIDLISHLNLEHGIPDSGDSGMQLEKEEEDMGLCFYCDEPQRSATHLSTHFDIKRGGIYVCPFCSLKMTCENYIPKHIATVHSKVCYVCKMKCTSRVDLISHLNKEHASEIHLKRDQADEKPSCFYCPEPELTFRHLSSHFAVRKGDTYNCHFCLFHTKESFRLLIHIRGYHSKECYICRTTFTNRTDLITHLKNVHDYKLPVNQEVEEPDQTSFCFYCPEPTQTVEHLSTHFTVTKEKRFSCHFCLSTFGMIKYRLLRHIRSFHRTECYLCRMTFSTRANLLSHLKDEHDSAHDTSRKPTFQFCSFCRQFIDGDMAAHREKEHFNRCSLCLKAFKTPISFRDHMQYIHGSEKPECKECGARYSSMYILNRHMKQHGPLVDAVRNKEKKTAKIECPTCKKMVSAHRFTEHRKRHESGRTVCSICGKSVKACDARIHETLYHQPSKCPICNKEYIGMQRAKNCRMKHTRSYKCEECGKDFPYSASLTLHKRLHTGEKPYACTECDRRFYSNQILYKHMLSHGIDTRAKGQRQSKK